MYWRCFHLIVLFIVTILETKMMRSSLCLSDTLYWSTKCGRSQEGEIEGFGRAPAENQGLARTANCYPQSSLDSIGLMHVSWPQAAGLAEQTAQQPGARISRLYSCWVVFNWLFYREQQHNSSVVGGCRRRTVGRQGRASYFRCYQALWSPRAACFLCGGLRSEHMTGWWAMASCFRFTHPSGLYNARQASCVRVCIHMFKSYLSFFISQQRLCLTQTRAATQHRPAV